MTVKHQHQCDGSVFLCDVSLCTGSALCGLRLGGSTDTAGLLLEVPILHGLCSSQRPILWLGQS